MNTKRILAALLAAACLSFAACSGGDGEGNKTTQTTTETKGETPAAEKFADLRKTVDSVKGFYNDGVSFLFTEDEYSEDTLIFTYGLEDEKFIAATESFVVTECEGMLADTFAVVKFKDGTDKALISEAVEAIKSIYVEGLVSKLSAYNPEECKAAENYVIKEYDSAIMLVISAKNADAIVSAAEK